MVSATPKIVSNPLFDAFLRHQRHKFASSPHDHLCINFPQVYGETEVVATPRSASNGIFDASPAPPICAKLCIYHTASFVMSSPNSMVSQVLLQRQEAPQMAFLTLFCVTSATNLRQTLHIPHSTLCNEFPQ